MRVHGKCDRVMGELMRRLAVPIPDFVRRETYILRVNSEGLMRVATDTFEDNCLFARELHVAVTDAVTGAHLWNAVAVPRKPLTLAPGVPVGQRVRVVAVVLLNASATVDMVKLEAAFAWGDVVEHRLDVEVVRRSFPLAEEVCQRKERRKTKVSHRLCSAEPPDTQDDGAWLERDLPRPEPRKRATREMRVAVAPAGPGAAEDGQPAPGAARGGKRAKQAPHDDSAEGEEDEPVVRVGQ